VRNGLKVNILAAAAATLFAPAVALAQDTTQKSAQPAAYKTASKPHKVWTEDDIESLRSPGDVYRLQKEAQAAAQASNHEAAPNKLAPQTTVAIKQPATLEETERAIKDSQDDIQDQKDTLARLSQELRESPADQKAVREKEIERRTAVLQESQNQLKAFQVSRDDLARKTAVARSMGKDVASASTEPSCNELSPRCPN
jgi:hypothetical protein